MALRWPAVNTTKQIEQTNTIKQQTNTTQLAKTIHTNNNNTKNNNTTNKKNKNLQKGLGDYRLVIMIANP